MTLLNDCFAGTIPPELGNVAALKQLLLNDNQVCPTASVWLRLADMRQRHDRDMTFKLSAVEILCCFLHCSCKGASQLS
jgi:hypothetical protein